MKNCPSCGKELPDEASFCVYCMTQLTPVTEISAPRRETGGGAVNKLLAGLCVLLAAAVVFLSVSVISGGTRDKNAYPASAGNEARTPTDEELYDLMCRDLIGDMARSAQALDSAGGNTSRGGFEYSYDSLDITPYGGPYSGAEDTIKLRTHLSCSAGEIFIDCANSTDYVQCIALGVPQANSSFTDPSLDAFRVMQVLYSARTGRTDTALYDFLRDDEKYPLSSENANWSSPNDRIAIWYDSVVNDDMTYTVTRKDAELDGINATLLVRTRRYGSAEFYDYQFIMF